MKNEIKKQLIKEFPYRLELHAHSSPASSCSDVPLEDWVRIFAEDGYDGLAMTNHLIYYYFDRFGGKQKYLEFIFEEFEKAQEIAVKYNMKIYLGAEIRFEKENGNDYLLYGIDKDIMAAALESVDGTLESFTKNYKSEKSILIQAHPFRDKQIHDSAEFIDGVEAFNLHPGHNSRIGLATRWAEEHGKLKTIGTDYHHYGHDNISATRSSFLPQDSFDIVKMYREDKYIFEIGDSIVIP